MTEGLEWGVPIVLYLFLAGLSAGALTTSTSVLLRGGGGGFGGEHFSIARYGAFIAPIPVMIGSGLLVLELGTFPAHPLRWINLFKTITWSPMSIGSWLLVMFIGLSVLYALTFVWKGAAPGDRWDVPRKLMAWAGVPLGIAVAVYTGILLGAMPARPFWNSPILALLFLISSISTGIAAVMLVRVVMRMLGRKSSDGQTDAQYHHGGYLLTATDTIFIGFELMVIFLFIMYSQLTIGSVKEAMTVILPGGSLAALFWIWFVLIGLIIPIVAEMRFVAPRLLYHRPYVSHRAAEILVPVLIIVGGFMLRYVVVIAGQITGPVGL